MTMYGLEAVSGDSSEFGHLFRLIPATCSG